MERYEIIRQWAEDAGATHVRTVSPERLKVKDSVRQACLVNACGKSGKNWMCPPQIGDLEVCEARMGAFAAGILVQNIAPLEDSWDFEAMEDAIHAHNRMLRDLTDRANATYPDLHVLALGAGGCDICERCTCPDAPCRFPDRAVASVESNGLDVKELVEACGLHYINGVNTVSYVGLLLLR